MSMYVWLCVYACLRVRMCVWTKALGGSYINIIIKRSCRFDRETGQKERQICMSFCLVYFVWWACLWLSSWYVCLSRECSLSGRFWLCVFFLFCLFCLSVSSLSSIWYVCLYLVCQWGGRAQCGRPVLSLQSWFTHFVTRISRLY